MIRSCSQDGNRSGPVSRLFYGDANRQSTFHYIVILGGCHVSTIPARFQTPKKWRIFVSARNRVPTGKRTFASGAAGDNNQGQPWSVQVIARIAHYDSIDAFKRAAEDVVGAKKVKDPYIEKVLANLLRTCAPKEAAERALVDYYAQFFPAQDVLAAK